MSEFGTGYAYCLGLFLAHAERISEYRKTSIINASLWFNGAADHLHGLEIPNSIPDEKQAEISEWRLKCLHWRLDDSATWEDADKALQTAKDLLLAWDLQCGINAEKGEWE